jgi:hypothetical protein
MVDSPAELIEEEVEVLGAVDIALKIRRDFEGKNECSTDYVTH